MHSKGSFANVVERGFTLAEQVFSNMLGLFHGQVYYNLLNWYRLVRLFPGFNYNKRFMESMMGVQEPAELSEQNAAPGFWRHRIVDPIVTLLRQGTSPEMIARTIAVGTTCALFPFLGTTSALNLVVGWILKMNQPILQTLNQLLGPVQLVMILVYVRIGEWIWQDSEHRFSVTEVIEVFRDVSFSEFLSQFGWAGIHAFTAWALTAPVCLAAVYFLFRPLVIKIADTAAPERSIR